MIFELFKAELTARPIDLNGDWLEPSPPLSLPSPLTYITELSFNKSLPFSSRSVVFASAPLIAIINEKKINIPTKVNRTIQNFFIKYDLKKIKYNIIFKKKV